MDNTLFQLVRALFDAHQKIDLLTTQLQKVQAEFTDLKQKLEPTEKPPT